MGPHLLEGEGCDGASLYWRASGVVGPHCIGGGRV